MPQYFVPLRRPLFRCEHCGALIAMATDDRGRPLQPVEPSPRTAEYGLGGPLLTRTVRRRRYGRLTFEAQTGQMMQEHKCRQEG